VHSGIAGLQVWLCRDCGRYFRQRLPGILPRQRASEAYQQAIYQQHLDGSGIDVAKERADFFLARDRHKRLRLARRYYTPARAAKFKVCSTSEIIELCWAWFNPFQLFARRSRNHLAEIGDQLDVLVGSEYVAMTWGLLEDPPSYDSGTLSIDIRFPEDIVGFCSSDPPQVFPLPDSASNFGDAFETIVYSYSGQRLRVCKSVSEPFLPVERDEAMDEIERLFLENADEEGDDPRSWRVNFRRLTAGLLPEFGRALIEADIFGEVGTAEEKEYFQILKEELKPNGDGYLKRPQNYHRRRRQQRG